MKRSGDIFFDHEELLSSVDIQDWNLKTFAAELNENIGQILSLTKFQIATLNPDKNEETKQIVERSDWLLAKAIKDLRNLARLLTPTEIIQKGFTASVQCEFERLKEAGICKITYIIQGKPYRLEGIRELILFSILQSYIYKALYEEKSHDLELQINYREKSIGLKMRWKMNGENKNNGSRKKMSNNILKRAKLINATIRERNKGLEKNLTMSIKKLSS